jgi:hypothetical protein
MTKPLAAIALAALTLSACASPDGTTYADRIEAGKATGLSIDRVRVGPGDLADMGTTAYGLWSGIAAEANPLLAPFGDAVPLVGTALKYGAKHGLVATGATPRQANMSIESSGMGAACWNAAIIAGAAPPIGFGLAVICGMIYYDVMEKAVEDRG